MLATLKELFDWRAERPVAIGSFTATTREDMQGVVAAAEDLRLPVILQASDNQLQLASVSLWATEATTIARASSVPVCIHLDHGQNYEICMQALRHGFTSVMRDASKLDFPANVAEVRAVVRAAHATGVSVEAELGQVGGIEDGVITGADGIYTDPQEAEQFVSETAVDALAVAIGSAHGLYQGPVNLDYTRATELSGRLPVPLVLHGGSGIDQESLEKVIEAGVAKINIGTEIKHAQVNAWVDYLRQKPQSPDPKQALTLVREAVYAVAKQKMQMFASLVNAEA